MLPGVAIARECLDAAAALRRFEEDPLVSPLLLRHQVGQVVDRMIAEARARGYLAEEIDALAYPVVALLDEVALRKGGMLAETWAADLLQVAHFHENVAGDRFFERLESLRAGPRGGRAREALEVHFACLALGFQGRYQLGGEAELAGIFERLAGDLDLRGPPGALSPSAEAPKERRLVGRAAFPILGVAVALLVLAGVLVALLQIRIDGEAERVAGRLRAAAAGPAGSEEGAER